MNCCSVQGCAAASAHRGLCGKHYQRWWKHGDATIRLKRANGEGSVDREGYVHRARKREHIEIAERALGKPLPVGVIVHHVDESRSNNAPTNLVICPSRAYHALLHRRMRALAICGHAEWLKCKFCGVYDDPANLSLNGLGRGVWKHKACEAAAWHARHA